MRLRDVNGDGEADLYENFSNLSHQSGESREFPLGMASKPGGGFYLAIGSALDLGPKTSPAIMPGFAGCAFRSRCSHANETCVGEIPRRQASAAHDYLCRLADAEFAELHLA